MPKELLWKPQPPPPWWDKNLGYTKNMVKEFPALPGVWAILSRNTRPLDVPMFDFREENS